MFGLGIGEIAVILVIALIFIGPKKLPEIARGLGKGIREFQGAVKGITDPLNTPFEQNKNENKLDNVTENTVIQSNDDTEPDKKTQT